jgi:hypothetical protein
LEAMGSIRIHGVQWKTWGPLGDIGRHGVHWKTLEHMGSTGRHWKTWVTLDDIGSHGVNWNTLKDIGRHGTWGLLENIGVYWKASWVSIVRHRMTWGPLEDIHGVYGKTLEYKGPIARHRKTWGPLKTLEDWGPINDMGSIGRYWKTSCPLEDSGRHGVH